MSSVESGEVAEHVDDELRTELVDELRRHLGDGLLGDFIRPGREVWVRIERDAWRPTFQHLKADHGFAFFDFLSAIDWMASPYGRYEDAAVDKLGQPAVDEPAAQPVLTTGYAGGETRFQMFCRVYDVRRRLGIIVKADLPDDDLRIQTIMPVYLGANWHERELHEMFGIHVDGHPYLEKLYLPGGFEGYPLRKDYPLLARLVKPWPGIVDVEPMPGGGDDEEEES